MERSDRILVVSQRFWPEDQRINELCAGLEEKRLKIDVLCGQPNFPEGRFFRGYHTAGHSAEKYGKIRVFRTLEIRKDTGTSFRKMLNYLSFSVSSRIRAASLGKNRYSAVLVYQTSPVMQVRAAFRVAGKLNIPVVTYAVDIWPQCFFRELDIQNFLLRKLFTRISERMYLRSDRIIAQSEREAKYFTGTLHIHPNRVSVIPPAPFERFTKEVRDIAVMERYAGSFNIIISDPMLETQDYGTIFDAGRLIAIAGISDLRMIIIGKGRKLAALKKKVSRLRLSDMIFFEEENDPGQLPKFFSIASAFLSCRLSDETDELSFPGTTVDFMAAGKPILSTTGSAEKRLIRQARCGYTAEPEDPEGLSDIIIRMYRSRLEDIVKMGTNALEYAREHFSADSAVSGIMDVLFGDDNSTDDGFTITRNTDMIRTEDI